MREMAGDMARILVPSDHLLRELVEFGIPETGLRKLRHGLPASAGPKRELPERARCIVYVGSLVPHKGIDVLIEAFEGLSPETELIIAGSSPAAHRVYAEHLIHAARGLNVRFIGRVTNEAVHQLLIRADCLVAPSIWSENTPLTVQEAFSAGVPVIASDVPGHAELLAKGGGLLFETGNARDLHERLQAITEEAGLLLRIGQEIPAVEGIEVHVEKLTDIYHEVITDAARDR
jgi:glycosyltransferase involved in cell wall biosynthesis